MRNTSVFCGITKYVNQIQFDEGSEMNVDKICQQSLVWRLAVLVILKELVGFVRMKAPLNEDTVE